MEIAPKVPSEISSGIPVEMPEALVLDFHLGFLGAHSDIAQSNTEELLKKSIKDSRELSKGIFRKTLLDIPKKRFWKLSEEITGQKNSCFSYS